MESEKQQKSNRLRWVKMAVRVVVLGLVAWGIWRTWQQANAKFAAAEFSLADVHFGWLALAGLFYLIGMVPSWLFWHRTLWSMGQQPRWWETLRAFYIGHLGKYVPGKALVVVMRTGLVRSDRVDTTVAATSVFVETLTYMAVGAAVAASILIWVSDQTWLLALAVGLMLCAGVPTVPPIFRKLVKLLGVKRANPAIDQALSGLNVRLMAGGWLTIAVGWVLLGLSMWATLEAMPTLAGDTLAGDTGAAAGDDPVWMRLPLLTACVALAMVAGFLSLVPGGLGVRELVLIPLLSGPYGEVGAIVSAVLLRLVWLVAELLISVILYGVGRRPLTGRGAATEAANDPEQPASDLSHPPHPSESIPPHAVHGHSRL